MTEAAAGRFAGLTHVTALATRSVRADENRWVTHALRGAVCFVILLALYLAAVEAGSSDAPGLAVFITLISVDAAAVALGAFTFFPSIITEEKEARTLGLLRMADVGPAALLAGKTLPRLAVILLLLAVQMPLTLLAVTLGGVTWEQVLYSYWVLGVSTVTIAGLGALLSTIFGTTRQACSAMVGLVIGGYFSLMLAGLLIALAFGQAVIQVLGEWFLKWVWPVIPLAPVLETFLGAGGPPGMGSAGGWFGHFFWGNVVVASLLFAAAYVVLDRKAPDAGEAAEARPAGLRSFRRKDEPRRRAARRPWSAAVAWKDWWFVGGGKFGLIVRLVAYLGLPAGLAYVSAYPRYEPTLEEYGGIVMAIAGTCFFVELAVIASRLFRSELDNRTWASLMLLPQSTARTVAGKVAGAAITMAPSVACFAFGFLVAGGLDQIDRFLRDLSRDPELGLGIAYSVLLTAACTLMITYLSLRMRYGMIPLTAVIMGVGHAAAGFVFAIAAMSGVDPGSGVGVAVLACFAMTVLCFVLVELTRDKLGELAAAEE